jgi:acetyltransferase-like isoleucine patch superfamily enzyme
MSHKGTDWPAGVELDRGYFAARNIDLDLRGTLRIAKDSYWGFDIQVITLSHPVEPSVAEGITAPVVDRPVVVKSHAYICSGAQLYNCTIGEGAVVAFGAVVRSAEVRPGTMVAGNPARVIARWQDGRWNYLEPQWTVLE